MGGNAILIQATNQFGGARGGPSAHGMRQRWSHHLIWSQKASAPQTNCCLPMQLTSAWISAVAARTADNSNRKCQMENIGTFFLWREICRVREREDYSGRRRQYILPAPPPLWQPSRLICKTCVKINTLFKLPYISLCCSRSGRRRHRIMSPSRLNMSAHLSSRPAPLNGT